MVFYALDMLVFVGSGMSKSLGMRRKSVKCCLHDPFAEGALVLYSPPEVSAHDQLNQKEYVFYTKIKY